MSGSRVSDSDVIITLLVYIISILKDGFIGCQSCRSRPKSSDNWKPSDRQLGALLTALGDEKKAGSDVATELRNLYYDLKKLM